MKNLNEKELPDDYPVDWGYLYVCDGKVRSCDIKGTVKDLKDDLKSFYKIDAKVITNCDIEGRKAQLKTNNMKYLIYTANVGTIFLSCEDARPYTSKKNNGIQVIGMKDTVCVKKNAALIRSYDGIGRKIEDDLNPELILPSEFEAVFDAAKKIEVLQNKILKIRESHG